MPDPARRITIRIGGQAVKDGRISVSLLTRTLHLAQQALFQVAVSQQRRPLGKGGRYPASVEKECELFLVETRPGSRSAVLELPPREQPHLPQIPDPGESALDELKRTMHCVSAGDSDSIRSMLPNLSHRRLIVSTIAAMMPREGADYTVEASIDSGEHLSQMAHPGDDYISAVIGTAETAPETRVALIEAHCTARLTAEGELKKLIKVIDFRIEEDDVRPYRTEEIVWRGRVFLLKRQLACEARKEYGFWVLESKMPTIRAYAKTREEAIQEFGREFAMLWDEYAQVQDSGLTDDALALKRQMNRIVREVRG